MLVSSGQISVAISSGIVCIFTSLLFLSGYILQQQTVQSLQKAIHPKVAAVPATRPTTQPVQDRHFNDKYLASNRPSGGWVKSGYVQFARKHVDVCNTLIVFAALHEQNSLAQRILFYPEDWDSAKAGTGHDALVAHRLLDEARSKYRVILRPVNIDAGPATEKDGPQNRQHGDPERSSMLSSLINMHRLIQLTSPGIVLNADRLDSLFTAPMNNQDPATIEDSTTVRNEESSVVVIQSSQSLQDHFVDMLPGDSQKVEEYWSLVSEMRLPTLFDSDSLSSSQVVANSKSLWNVTDDFEAEDFLGQTGFIHLADERIARPDLESDPNQLNLATPDDGEARKAWNKIYKQYRTARMEICGLDLELMNGKLVEEEMLGLR